MRLPSPLYVILDRDAARGRPLPDLLEAVLAGGGRLFQLRDKTQSMVELLPLARALRARCRDAGALLFINDRADLALAVEADGLHVGQDDLPAAAARRILPPLMRLGVSTHDPDQARRALADGADYVAVGSMFPTVSKPGFQLVGPELVRRVRPDIPVPLVAIGGITETNVGEVMGAGADAVAVITAVCSAPDPQAATARFLKAIAACAPVGRRR